MRLLHHPRSWPSLIELLIITGIDEPLEIEYSGRHDMRSGVTAFQYPEEDRTPCLDASIPSAPASYFPFAFSLLQARRRSITMRPWPRMVPVMPCMMGAALRRRWRLT